MPPSPKGLGENAPSEFVLMKGSEPLPGDRKSIVARVENIISRGGVQKLVIQIGKPIEFWRHVRANESEPPPVEAPLDDLFERMRNYEMHEAYGATPLLLFAYAFAYLTDKGLKPACLYYGDEHQFRKFTGLGGTTSTIFGVPVTFHKEVPGDVLMLVGVSYDELDDETLSMRIPMDIPKPSTRPPGPPSPPKPPPGRKVA